MPTTFFAPPWRVLSCEWFHQAPVLERQHDRLEALLADLVDRHCLAEQERSTVGAEADTRDCIRLLRGLRLHLRLL